MSLMMVINWGLFLPAFILLLYPLERLLPATMKCRSYENLVDPAFRHRRRWWRWQPELWMDVVRIAVGVWFVKFSITAVQAEAEKFVTPVLGLVLAMALCVQMFTRRKEDTVLAPLGYLLAVSLVLLPVPVALSVFALAVVAMGALQDFMAFFVAGAMAAAVLGYFLGGGMLTAALLAGLYFLPALISMMTRRKLLLAVRSAAVSERVPSPLR